MPGAVIEVKTLPATPLAADAGKFVAIGLAKRTKENPSRQCGMPADSNSLPVELDDPTFGENPVVDPLPVALTCSSFSSFERRPAATPVPQNRRGAGRQ